MVRAVRFPDEARATAWRAMETLSREYGHFRVATIAALNPVPYPVIAEWVAWLRQERIVDAVSEHRFVVQVYGEAPPLNRMTNGRAAQQQRQMWAAFRKLRIWTIDDVAEAASTEDCGVTANAARIYTRALFRTGLVDERRGGWRLKPAADTGPRAPVPLDDGAVFDLNIGQLINLNAAYAAGRAA